MWTEFKSLRMEYSDRLLLICELLGRLVRYKVQNFLTSRVKTRSAGIILFETTRNPGKKKRNTKSDLEKCVLCR